MVTKARSIKILLEVVDEGEMPGILLSIKPAQELISSKKIVNIMPDELSHAGVNLKAGEFPLLVAG